MRRADRSLLAVLVMLMGSAAPAMAGRPGQPWPTPAQTNAAPAAAAPPARGETKPSDGFGRWESLLSQCQLQWPDRLHGGCLKLRLDQSIEGMLRVRFINAVPGSRYASEEMTFAGLLLKELQPMHCIQGACTPHWPLQIQVHGVASRRFDGRGLAEQLPNNQLAKGRCRLDVDQLSCQAAGPDGQTWKASARLPNAGAAKPMAVR